MSMKTPMNHIKRSLGAVFLVGAIFLALPEPAQAGTLSAASVTADTYAAGASATYTFTYTIATGSPNMIIYALFPTGFSAAALGSPLDTSKVTVTVNGVQKSINASGSWGLTSSFVVRLTTAADAGAGAVIVVTANGIVNPSTPGNYNGWTWIRTADSGGNEIDGWPGALPTITITAAAPVAAVQRPAPYVKTGTVVSSGESVKAGSTHLVFWTARGWTVSKYRISLSVNGGKTYRKINEGSDPFGGYYAWKVPNIAARDAKLKVELLGTGDAILYASESDSFRIAPIKKPKLPASIVERLKTIFPTKN